MKIEDYRTAQNYIEKIDKLERFMRMKKEGCRNKLSVFLQGRIFGIETAHGYNRKEISCDEELNERLSNAIEKYIQDLKKEVEQIGEEEHE